MHRHVRTLVWAGCLTALSIYGVEAIDHMRPVIHLIQWFHYK